MNKRTLFVGIVLIVIILLSGCGSTQTATNPPTDTSTAEPASPTQPANAASASPCNLAQMIITADWQGATGSLTGVLTFTNIGSTACQIQGTPTIELSDPSKKSFPADLVPSTAEAGQPVILEKGQSATSQFIWQNWCGDAPKGGLILTLNLAGYKPARMLIPVQDPNGQPRIDTPRCDDQNAKSTLTIKPIQAGGAPE